MLGDAPATTCIPVTDIKKAEEFYVGILGLKKNSDEFGGMQLEAGEGTHLFVYERQGATPEHTLASFNVADIYKVIEDLTAKGVEMEHYDQDPMKTDDKGVASWGEFKSAWFKDPFGNFLALDQR